MRILFIEPSLLTRDCFAIIVENYTYCNVLMSKSIEEFRSLSTTEHADLVVCIVDPDDPERLASGESLHDLIQAAGSTPVVGLLDDNDPAKVAAAIGCGADAVVPTKDGIDRLLAFLDWAAGREDRWRRENVVPFLRRHEAG